MYFLDELTRDSNTMPYKVKLVGFQTVIDVLTTWRADGVGLTLTVAQRNYLRIDKDLVA